MSHPDIPCDVQSVDFQSVYRNAVTTTQAAKATRENLEADAPARFVESVIKVRADILDDILQNAASKIMDAAAKGLGAVDLFRFNGNDSKDDISVLFVIKGHRAQAVPPPPGTPGPLLPDLQAMLAPFVIVHDWDGISGGNRIVARWI